MIFWLKWLITRLTENFSIRKIVESQLLYLRSCCIFFLNFSFDVIYNFSNNLFREPINFTSDYILQFTISSFFYLVSRASNCRQLVSEKTLKNIYPFYGFYCKILLHSEKIIIHFLCNLFEKEKSSR